MEPQEVYELIESHYRKLPSNKEFLNGPLKYAPSINEDEAYYFGLGLKNNLFQIDEGGYVQSPLLPKASSNALKQKMLCLFWRFGQKWFLFREGVCQIALASKLIYKYGWSDGEIFMEPGRTEFKNFAYGVDILVRPHDNFNFCIEVKRNQKEYEKLVQGFEYCCHVGNHSKKQCKFPQNHAKFEFCMMVKPKYLLFAAPEISKLYELNYVNDGIFTSVVEQEPYKKDMILAESKT